MRGLVEPQNDRLPVSAWKKRSLETICFGWRRGGATSCLGGTTGWFRQAVRRIEVLPALAQHSVVPSIAVLCDGLSSHCLAGRPAFVAHENCGVE